jgi:dTMP kinase
MTRGTLIVFEGPEGAGKTTQARKLVARLEALRRPCLQLREPGGTAVGEAIRQLLLDPDGTLAPATEALLFMASRAELVVSRIRPALEQGITVVLDRFFLSTYAYQVAGRGLEEPYVRAANQLAAGGLVPDVTIFLDLPVEAGLSRASARGGKDRIERAGDDFHNRVGGAFRMFTSPEWQREHPECGRIVPVEASGAEDEVFARIVAVLSSIRSGTFGALVQGAPSI